MAGRAGPAGGPSAGGVRGDPRSRLPRYQQVARQLAEAIGSSRYAVGAKLPTEAELCKQFRISRYTAREALRQLTESGLISRRRGAGSTVEAAAPPEPFMHSLMSLADVTHYAEGTRLRIERRAAVEPVGALAELLDGAGGRAWLKLDAVRVKAGEKLPICLTTVYLAPDVAPVAVDLPRETGPIHGHIERDLGVKVARVEQRIHATVLDEREAERLGSAVGTPALRMVRRYFDASGRLFEVSESLHPGDRYVYATTMRRD